MSLNMAAQGLDRLYSRDGFSHTTYQAINQALVIVGLTTGTFSLALYTYTSVRISRQFGLHNIFTIIAWILAVGFQSLTLYGFSDGGIGKHESTLSDHEMTRFTDVILAIIAIFIPMVCVAKLSLITIYYRLDPLGVFWKVYIYSITVILVIPSVVLVILYIFGCRPLQMAWDSSITDGHCVDRVTILLTSSVFNVITDFLMIIAPIPLVWDLQMRPLHKVGVVLMFFLGCITIITSICRVITVHRLLSQSDHPYHMATPILWANAETILIIICDCLPSFRIFLRHHFPSDSETESGNLTRTPQSDTQNPTEQELRSWFDDDIELIRNSGQAPDHTVVGRTINMDLQNHKFGTSVTVYPGNDRELDRV